MDRTIKKGTRICHRARGLGTVYEDSYSWKVIAIFDKCGKVITVSLTACEVLTAPQ